MFKWIKMKNRAFTFLEMIIAMAIFLILIGLVSSIFVMAIRSQNRTLVAQEMSDQISYTLEYMSRALRMAKKDLTASCIDKNTNYQQTADWNIKFLKFNYEESADFCYEFYLEDERIKMEKTNLSTGTLETLDLTSPKLKINSLKFKLSGQSQTDNLQPEVTIYLEAQPAKLDEPKIKIQTTISQRNLDVQR